jgi:type VI secretion system secreted protein VgrG
VKPDFDRESTEPGYGYLWLRMAKPYSGDTYGWHTPLTDGTEVAIAYSRGDIDLPYISTLYMTLNIRTPLPVTTAPATGHSPGKQHAVDEGLPGRGPVKLATNSLYLVSVGCAHRHFSS